MLVRVRITSFWLLVLVIGEFSTVYLVQGGDNAGGKCDTLVVSRKEGLPEGAIQTMNENMIGGRKMASHEHDAAKIDKMKQEGEQGKDPKRPRILNSRENYGARFVAFNADYRGPRHHPPKNN